MIIDEITEFAKYLESIDKSNLTIISYKNDIQLFAKWFEKYNKYSCIIDKISSNDIVVYKEYLIKKDSKISTINRKISSLKYFVMWAWEMQKIDNIIKFPKPMKNTALKIKCLSKDEQRELIWHFERRTNYRDAAIIKILLYTGIRVGELCNLKWKDINIANGDSNIIILDSDGNKLREVPLNKHAKLAFMSMANNCDYISKSKAIFTGQRDALTPRGIQGIMSTALENTELSGVSPNDLRNTFCKNLANQGITIDELAKITGHKSLDRLKIFYCNSRLDLHEAVEKIDNLG